MPKIALIGYGKMGHEVERLAEERGHKIVLKIDQDNQNELTPERLRMADVAIEFTSPKTAFHNVIACFDAGIPVVCGTTGWNDQLHIAVERAKKGNASFFYSSNYSIGVNIFFKLNRMAAAWLNRVGGYEVSITEIHHTQKLDAPSGTAITLANIINEQMGQYSGWSLLPDRFDDRLPIQAIREGQVPGTHVAAFESEQDVLTIKHEAKNRRGFALGAVLAAEFLYLKVGYYTMDDLIKLD